MSIIATRRPSPLAFADAVNAEINDLFAAGADVVQIDEPWMQQYPDQARAYGLKALNRALEGVAGTSRCTSASAMRPWSTTSPPATRFSPSSKARKAQQISIEAAQPHLDLAVLGSCPQRPSF